MKGLPNPKTCGSSFFSYVSDVKNAPEIPLRAKFQNWLVAWFRKLNPFSKPEHVANTILTIAKTNIEDASEQLRCENQDVLKALSLTAQNPQNVDTVKKLFASTFSRARSDETKANVVKGFLSISSTEEGKPVNPEVSQFISDLAIVMRNSLLSKDPQVRQEAQKDIIDKIKFFEDFVSRTTNSSGRYRSAKIYLEEGRRRMARCLLDPRKLTELHETWFQQENDGFKNYYDTSPQTYFQTTVEGCLAFVRLMKGDSAEEQMRKAYELIHTANASEGFYAGRYFFDLIRDVLENRVKSVGDFFKKRECPNFHGSPDELVAIKELYKLFDYTP